MKVTKEIIIHTAKLANIEVKESEIDKYLTEFNKILNYIEKLNELAIEEVKGTSYIYESDTPLRKDSVKPSLTKEETLGNSPEKDNQGTFFKVPKFIE